MRPLNVSEIIDETFQLYRKKFLLFLSISAVLMIPLGLVQVLQQVAMDRQSTTSGILTVGLMSLVIGILQFLIRLGVLSAIIYAASELRLGREPGVQEAYLNGMDHVPSMIKVTTMVSILIVLTSIPGIVIPVILGLFVHPVFFVLVLAGLALPVYLAVCWLLVLMVTVIEGESGFSSLGRSRELVRGNWWRVLGITILVSIIVFIIQAIFSIPSMIAGAGVVLSRGTTSISTSAAVIITLFNTAGAIVTGPILYIAWILLYYDLRARKEGLDLEMMAGRAEIEAQTASTYQ